MERQYGPVRGRGLPVEVQRQSVEEAGLRTLVSRLGSDATQLIHDELELGKLELRNITEALSADLRNAGRTLVRDLTRLGASLVLALLAGLSLTVAAILGVGLLVGAYWAGALIVGVLLAIAAAALARNATSDMGDSDALRLDSTRRAARRATGVVADEAQRTKEFASEEAAEFRRRATGSAQARGPH
jgi:hypothetical protein